MLIETARNHLLAGGLNRCEFRLVSPAKLMIRPRCRKLDRAESMYQPAMHRPAGERKVLGRAQCVDAPQNTGGNFAAAEKVGFSSIIHGSEVQIPRPGLADPPQPLGQIGLSLAFGQPL